MTTPRTAYRIDVTHPGSDIVAETAAAMASASIAFRQVDLSYAETLLTHAKEVKSVINIIFHWLLSPFLCNIHMHV